MKTTADQIRDDLRGSFRGSLHFDEVTRILYAADASPFRVMPAGVAVPLDESDLGILAKYADDRGIPLVPRGAGTGLAGESLGPGIAVDLSVHFRAIPEIGSDWVTVEAGVTHAEVNAVLALLGRRFAPDPASSATCTVGGMVGTNASGGSAFRHGFTSDHVRGLRVVWHSGETAELARPPISASDPTSDAVANLLETHRDAIATHRPRTPFDRCGYALREADTPHGPDLVRLLVGSEGTLAFVTAATLATIPLAGGTCLAVLGFPTLDAAIRAGLLLRTVDAIVGCDLLDPRQLALSRSAGGLGLAPASVGAALILTFEAETETAAERAGRAAVNAVRAGHIYRVLAEPTCQPAGVARIRKFREGAVGGLNALGPGPRPVAGMEDCAVPADELPRFVTAVQGEIRKAGLSASLLTHVLTGQVHARPFANLADPADRAKLWPLADAIHRLAIAHGGTISGQHGTGLARTPWVEAQVGPLLPAFRELKRIFDPNGILNPGKILGPDPSRPAWPLMETGSGEATARKPILLWNGSDVPAAAAACNSCGDCRTRSTSSRMCPTFRATGSEAASPRAKATLLQTLLATDPGRIADGDVRAVAALCVNCKMCRDECRAGVDVPKLMLETKAAHHAANGLDRADWVLARAESLSAFAGNFAFTTNRLLGNRPARWLIEKLFGVSRQRTLPKFTNRTFLRRARRAGLSGIPGLPRTSKSPSQNKVAYFVDAYANTNDPLIGEATVAVLRHHGFEVAVPPRQRACGMAALAQGDVETARETAAHNVRVLIDYVRDGYTVVCSEPTAAIALTQDYLDLLDDPDAKRVAENTVELTAFLGRILDSKRLKTDFRRLDVQLGHHVPCHVKALRAPAVGPRLLEAIPGVRVHTVDVGCSGMAGTFGLKAANYATSLAAGAAMFAELNRPRVTYGSTECSSCRMQMQEGSGKRTFHPVEWLALAYGLVPELDRKLPKPLTARVTE